MSLSTRVSAIRTERDATVSGERWLVVDAVGPALSAGQSGAVLTASDVVVPNRVAELGSIAERVVLNENRGVGVTVVGSASDYRFDDIVIADTLSWRCSEPDWDGPACVTSYGIGFAAMAGISELAGFSVRGSRVAGMSIQSGARLVGSDGEVVNNAIGVHDRSQSFGLEESLDRVVLSDNGVEIDTDELEVPSLAETLETLGEP